MNRPWWEKRVGVRLAGVIEDRLALGGRDVGDILVELTDEGLVTHARLRELVMELETIITLSEGPVQGSDTASLRVVGELGRGAMGFVHAARDPSLGRNVAIKQMDPAAASNAALLGRFKAEAQITAQLDHPGIVPVYTLAVDARGVPSYSMKLIRGKTLTEYLDEASAFYDNGSTPREGHDLPSRLSVFLQICNAVAYAHARGVLHRDLKPDNVMLGAFHEILVVDWGVAKLIGSKEDPIEGLPTTTAGEGTEIGTVIGTPNYCSPEQARGENDTLDARSDQYALGLILYELVSLGRALTGKTAYLVLLRASNADLNPLKHEHGDRIPRELAAIIRRATRSTRGQRYDSVQAMADDVRRYLRDEAVLAAPDTGLQRVGRWVSRHRQATVGLFAMLLAALFGVALFGLAGAVIATELSERAAEARERRVVRALTFGKDRASAIDAELFNTEALVTGIAAAAAEALTHPPAEGVPVYLATTFGTPDGPPDQVESAYYEGIISMNHPDVHVPSRVDLASVQTQLAQLASLQPQLRRALLRSESEELALLPASTADARVLDEGVLATWTYVATEQGVLSGYPGIGGYPLDYDPRTRPWYRVGFEGQGAQWSALTVEEGDFGLLLTCTLAVRDADERRLGVAAADLAFGLFIDRYLDPPELTVPFEAWLVDEDDTVVIRSSQKASARTMTEYEPDPFPVAEVLASMRSEASGHQSVTVDGERTLFVWTPLTAVPWVYVLEIKESDLDRL